VSLFDPLGFILTRSEIAAKFNQSLEWADTEFLPFVAYGETSNGEWFVPRTELENFLLRKCGLDEWISDEAARQIVGKSVSQFNRLVNAGKIKRRPSRENPRRNDFSKKDCEREAAKRKTKKSKPRRIRRMKDRESKPIDPRLTNRRSDCWEQHPADLPDTRGELHRTSRLTEKDILAIRAHYEKKGGLIRDVAIKFKISPNHAGDILRGKTWRHLKLSNLLYKPEF